MATDKEQSILTEAQGLAWRPELRLRAPVDDFSRTAAIWTALLGGKLKLTARASSRKTLACAWSASSSRQINQPKRDNLTDAAGYCETVRMVIDERARREKIRRLSPTAAIGRRFDQCIPFQSLNWIALAKRPRHLSGSEHAKAPAAHERRRHG